jgi:phage terminase large subunit-like protein
MLQLPTRYTKPLSDDFETDGDRLIALVDAAWRSPENPNGLQLDEWQRWLIRAILERYPDGHPLAGRLRYRQVVVSMGRQNGKSILGAILGLYGLLLHEPGPYVVSLASSVEQAAIIYERVLYAVDNNNHLSKRFKRATETRGIVTQDGGGRYVTKPASERALQGLPISLCLFDELHLAKKGMWTAAVLGTAARKDGLVVGITTAGDETSETLIELYKEGDRAVTGDEKLERFGFFCWEAPEGAPVDDPQAIMAANPMVAAGRVNIEQVISDLRTLPEQEARRYRLNQFISGRAAAWLPAELFIKARGNGVQTRQGLVFAVDATKNLGHCTVSVASRVDDIYETELVASFVNPDEDKLFDYLVDKYKKHNAVAIALDPRMLNNLGKRLKQAGVNCYSLWTGEISSACSSVYSLFAAGRVKHKNDPLLVAQMPNGQIRYAGESWLISRKHSVGDIDAVMATVMALYVCSVQPKNRIQVF